MRILFIKPKHIGDSLILTPTIAAAKRAYPNAEIWIVVRSGCEGILAGCPQIDRIVTVAGVNKKSRTWREFRQEVSNRLLLFRTRFDYLFELGDGHRGRWVAVSTRSRKKYSVKTATPLSPFWQGRFDKISTLDWDGMHRVEKDFLTVNEFLPLTNEIPGLVFERTRAAKWAGTDALSSFGVIHVGTRQRSKIWQVQNWIAVGRNLVDRFGAVVISSGPDAEEVSFSAEIAHAIGPHAVMTRGQTSWSEIAGLLYRAQLLVTLDTATMHLGAACGCPIVALFGPTIEDNWRPWKACHEIVVQPDFKREPGVAGFPQIRQRSMAAVRVEDVLAACERMSARSTAGLLRS